MEIEPLIWTVAGILLILAEFAVPGLIVIFFGTSALMVGIGLYFGLPTAYGIPFICFSVLSVLQVIFLRRFFKSLFVGASVENAEALEEFIGHEAIVISGFEEGDLRGKVEFKGSSWSARSEGPLKPGERVQITARDGLNLTVSAPR